MKKRVLLLLLAAAMLLMLTACRRGEPQPAQTEDTTVPAATHPPVTVTEPATPGPMLGSFDPESGVYTNGFLGLRCTLNASWEVYDAARIGELVGLTADSVSDEAIGEVVRENGSAILFYAQTAGGLATVNISVEDLGILYGSVLSEADYAERVSLLTAQGLESMGMTEVSAKIASVEFAGAAHTAVTITGSYASAALYECLVCVRQGNYMIVVTVLSTFEDSTGELLAMFSSL